MDNSGNIGHHDIPLRYRYIPTPQVYISLPTDGEILSSSPITVTGVIYDAKEVLVNGIPAQIDVSPFPIDINQFTATIQLKEGTNAVTVIAKNQVKAKAETIYVTYTPGTTITLQSIAIEPSSISVVPFGNTLQLSAIGTYSNGQTIDLTRQSTWTSSNINTATVNNGLVTGITEGGATITAAYGGLTASQTITVGQPALKTIRVAYEWTIPDGRVAYFTDAPLIQTGETLQFRAFGYYSDDQLRDISYHVTWAGSDTTVAAISTSGLATATSKGTTQISATCTGTAEICGAAKSIIGTTTLTVTPPPVYLFITSPTDGGTVNKGEVTITGTIITSAQEAGITVNGVIANVYGNQFTANHVPLIEGSNTIIAKAVDSNGATAEAKVTIIAAQAANTITLTSNIESGIAPMEVTLTVDSNLDLTNSYITYTYPGTTPPEVTAISSEEYKVKMTTEGIYTFTANVTDAQGNTYTDTIVLTVLNRNTIDALLKAKWEGMKTALINGDVEGAVSFFEEGSQAIYREQFTALKPVLNLIVNEMGQIYLARIEDNSAEYEIITTRNGVTYSFHLLFIRNQNGIWKITMF